MAEPFGGASVEELADALFGRFTKPVFAQETRIVNGKEITYPVIVTKRSPPVNARCVPARRVASRARSYPRTRACFSCRGKCCKQLPGCAMPGDFGRGKAVLAGVRAALLTGRWALDWWEGNPMTRSEWRRTPKIDAEEFTFLFVRPAVKGKEGQLHHGAWGGECTFLTDSGCELPARGRPRECRLLEPQHGGRGNCVAHGASKRVASVAWARHDLEGLAIGIEREREHERQDADGNAARQPKLGRMV